MKILITTGATREKIDAIRFITNFSTGNTGKFIASYFSKIDWSVTLLKPTSLDVSFEKIKTDSFVTFVDLKEKLEYYLKNYSFDAVIHLAAVGDFSVDYIKQGETTMQPPDEKLKTSPNLTIGLNANPKLLPTLRSLSKNPNIIVVGFKLTCGHSFEPVIDDFVDIVVHNRYEDIKNNYKAKIYTKSINKSVNNKEELALGLTNMIKEHSI